MDKMKGIITESARTAAGGKEKMTMGGIDRRHSADHQQVWSGLRPSRGLFAGTSPENAGVRQQGLDISADWAPASARSSLKLVCDDTKNTKNTSPLGAAVPTSVTPVAPRWNHQQQQQQGVSERVGRAAAAAHYSTGLLDCHRPGWKRTEVPVSDVENGKGVESAGGQDSQALEPQPSGSPLPDTFIVPDQLQRSCARAAHAEWALSSVRSSHEPLSSPPLGAAIGDGALAAPSHLVSDATGPSGAEQGSSLQLDSRRGWKWSPMGLPSSPTRGLHQRRYRFDSSPCLDSKLDAEMAVFESQLTRSLSGYLSSWMPVTCPLNSEISPHAQDTSAPVVADVASSPEKTPSALVTGVGLDLKRKRADLPDGDVQGECGWTQPLKLLVRKGLTSSDAGELGRIVLPKKDAESLSFPQIDTKEGVMLEMEDYMVPKRWYFRFKYWTNNKSRMYVLENTGDFIRYHCLKEHDVFLIFEDSCKKFVVRCLNVESGDPVLKLIRGSVIESSTSQAPLSTTDDGSRCNAISTTSTDAVLVCS